MTKTYKQGTNYNKFDENNQKVIISQAEKDELDDALTTHQGDAPDLDTVVSIAIVNNEEVKTFLINYIKTDASKAVYTVNL